MLIKWTDVALYFEDVCFSRDFTTATAPDSTSFQTSGTLLKAVYDWTFILGPNFMLGLNTMMYSFIFYKSKIVPRFLAILGMTGATLVLSKKTISTSPFELQHQKAFDKRNS